MMVAKFVFNSLLLTSCPILIHDKVSI